MTSKAVACVAPPEAAPPRPFRLAIIVQWYVRAYARTTAFFRLFLGSRARLCIGLPSSMTLYPAPRAPPKVVEGARDPPDPPYSFPVPSRPPADACGAGLFSFFTPNTSKKSPEKAALPGRWAIVGFRKPLPAFGPGFRSWFSDFFTRKVRNAAPKAKVRKSRSDFQLRKGVGSESRFSDFCGVSEFLARPHALSGAGAAPPGVTATWLAPFSDRG